MSNLAVTSQPVRDKVNALESMMREMPQVDMPVTNYFSKGAPGRGVYARELFIPKGTVLTGKIHKYENLNIMLQGELSVLVGDEIVRVKAPFTIVSPPGTKRIAYAHEDTIWITVHGTDETDMDKIENEFVAQSDIEYIEFSESLKLEEKQ
jgi:quercetin dioxygenase-like cupin family protein